MEKTTLQKDTHIISYDFEVKVLRKIIGESELRNNVETIADLNKQASNIEQKISRRMRKFLPPGVQVSVSVEFERGSILGAAVLNVLSFAGTIGGAIGFLKMLEEHFQKSVNSAVRHSYPLHGNAEIVNGRSMVYEFESSDLSQVVADNSIGNYRAKKLVCLAVIAAATSLLAAASYLNTDSKKKMCHQNEPQLCSLDKPFVLAVTPGGNTETIIHKFE